MWSQSNVGPKDFSIEKYPPQSDCFEGDIFMDRSCILQEFKH